MRAPTAAPCSSGRRTSTAYASTAMSWEADAKAIANASAATTHGVSGRWPTPASMSVSAKSATCATAAQPRRRPSHGGAYRSISGDQRTLNAHGAWASVMSPTTEMLTPLLAIQSGTAIMTRPNGRPEENERSDTAAVRHDVIAWLRLRKAPGRWPPATLSARRDDAGTCSAASATHRNVYQPACRGATSRPLALRLQRRLVVPDEGADLLGHVEEPRPLLLVERHGEPPEAVDRDTALLAHLDRDPAARGAFESLVLGSQARELAVRHVVGHGARVADAPRHCTSSARGERLRHGPADATATPRVDEHHGPRPRLDRVAGEREHQHLRRHRRGRLLERRHEVPRPARRPHPEDLEATVPGRQRELEPAHGGVTVPEDDGIPLTHHANVARAHGLRRRP